MENNDRNLILGLARRLRDAQPVQKDRQAAELIGQEIARQPDAIYVLAQAVLVQEQALRTAQARIDELTAEVERASSASAGMTPSGGFMNRLFGNNQQATGFGPGQPPGQPQPPDQAPQSGGGGFLKTAAAAAAGVAGGGLLLQGLSSAFGDEKPSAAAAFQPDVGSFGADEQDDASYGGGEDAGW
ncbi:DUF2076 domain-containing protein [Nocardia colli]|uniref:DUF2076 domain-containing protein n=1 Tax=Nocardia colli TaxID=2545717 RepID=UPI0035E2AC2C